MDQDEYIKALIPISSKEIVEKKPDELASSELVSSFRSLLGAIAYTQLTQHQIACYIVALQRVAHKLTINDVRRLNVLTKRLQGKPATIEYKALKLNPRTQTLTVFSDAGFKKEETDGYALRGAVYLRHFEPLYLGDGTPTAGVNCHMLRAESRSLKTVVRSTYAAELLSAAAAGDWTKVERAMKRQLRLFARLHDHLLQHGLSEDDPE
jgi:hypothetical protein